MTDGAHDAGGGFGRSAGANAARGVMVIVAAVVVGLLLMQRGLSDTSTTAAGGSAASDAEGAEAGDAAGTGETADGATGDTTADDAATASSSTTSTTLAPPRDPSEVKVLVLNATDGVKGAAGRGTQALLASNYRTGEPDDATANGPSMILFQPGFEAEARAVAELFGVDPAALVQPFDAAASLTDDTQESNLIVVIGNDGLIQV